MHPDLAARLKAIPLFAGIGDDALAALSDVVSEFEADAGHTLVQPDTAPTGVFVLESGTVHVELGADATTTLGPGECVGELAILTPDALRTARVRVAEPVRGLAIRRDDFLRTLDAEPKLAGALVRVLAARLVEADRLLRDASRLG